MVSYSDQIVYACVSRGTTILADFSSGDSNVETLAMKCLEHTPNFHLLYSHTTRTRIYCFLIEEPFVYFAILNEDFGKSQGFEFLERLKTSFTSFFTSRSIKSKDHLDLRCFQDEFSPVLRFLMNLSGERDQMGNADLRTQAPMLERKKKKISNGEEIREVSLENMLDPAIDGNEITERSLSPQKSGCSGGMDGGWQQARKIWRQQAAIVLLVDFVVCCILFGVWMMICKGFHCIDR